MARKDKPVPSSSRRREAAKAEYKKVAKFNRAQCLWWPLAVSRGGRSNKTDGETQPHDLRTASGSSAIPIIVLLTIRA
jgi:hypothetical protein